MATFAVFVRFLTNTLGVICSCLSVLLAVVPSTEYRLRYRQTRAAICRRTTECLVCPAPVVQQGLFLGVPRRDRCQYQAVVLALTTHLRHPKTGAGPR